MLVDSIENIGSISKFSFDITDQFPSQPVVGSAVTFPTGQNMGLHVYNGNQWVRYSNDSRQFVSDRVMTIHEHGPGGGNPAWGWKGLFVNDGNTSDLGSMTDMNVNGETLVVCNIQMSSTSTVFNVIIRFEDPDNNIPSDLFEYIEIENVGRFYVSDGTRSNFDTGFRVVTQFAIPVTVTEFNLMPSSGTKNIQFA